MSQAPYITGTQLATARAKLCAAMAALGSAADSLSVLEQIAINPVGEFADGAAIELARTELADAITSNVIAVDELAEFLALPVQKEAV